MPILIISTTFVSIFIWMLVFFSDVDCVFLNFTSLRFKIKKSPAERWAKGC